MLIHKTTDYAIRLLCCLAGGFSLARSPENISLWDVFTCMENGEGLVPTAPEDTALGEFYTMVEEEFRAKLQEMTLKNLCRQKREP